MKKRVLVLLGPNLNMVGIREKGVYGDESAESIEEQIRAKAESMGYVCDIFQSNWEGALIDKIHEARERYDGVVLNAGGYTHTSVALADAIGGVDIPVVEVHISCILAREEFRHVSLIAPKCKGSVMGFGLDSYRLGILSFLE